MLAYAGETGEYPYISASTLLSALEEHHQKDLISKVFSDALRHIQQDETFTSATGDFTDLLLAHSNSIPPSLCIAGIQAAVEAAQRFDAEQKEHEGAEQRTMVLDTGGPIQPLAAAELPGTIGIDVRALSTDDMLIDRVLRGSPAYSAGLRAGDRLKSINEACAASVPYSRIIKTKPGKSVRLTVTRNGKAFTYDMVAVRLDLLGARIAKQKRESAQVVQVALNNNPRLSR